MTSAGLDWDREKWRGSVASKFIRGGEKNAVKYADEIIVLSKDVQKYFLETYGRETHFIPNGVNRPQIREASLITDKFGLKKDSYILFLGRLVPEKGIRYLVEAFKNVKTDKKLVIAGGSSDTDISTDYVFDGQGTEPWQPDCKDYKPLNVYGQTKLEGELAVSQTLEKYFIVRIAWVFGLNGGTHKMRERYAEIDSKLLPMLSDNQECLNRINETIPKAGNIASYIQRNSQYPIYQNTDIVYFDEAVKGLEAQLKDLEKAQKFIFMEYHAIEDAEAWHKIQDVLEERVKAGVEVRVFYDDMGSMFGASVWYQYSHA